MKILETRSCLFFVMDYLCVFIYKIFCFSVYISLPCLQSSLFHYGEPVYIYFQSHLFIVMEYPCISIYRVIFFFRDGLCVYIHLQSHLFLSPSVGEGGF